MTERLLELYRAVNSRRDPAYYADAVTAEWQEYRAEASPYTITPGDPIDMQIEAADVIVRCMQLIKSFANHGWNVEALIRAGIVKTTMRQQVGKDKELEREVLERVLTAGEVVTGDDKVRT